MRPGSGHKSFLPSLISTPHQLRATCPSPRKPSYHRAPHHLWTMHLAWATSSNMSWWFINHRLQPAALMYIDVCALICIGNTRFNFDVASSQLFLFLIDHLQVPEAFPCRTQYLLPAGSSGCPSTQDVMPDGFSLSPLYPCSGGRTVPKAVRWLSGKGQNPGGPGGLCRSPHIAPLGRSHVALCSKHVAPSTWHLLSAKNWGYMTGLEGTRWP